MNNFLKNINQIIAVDYGFNNSVEHNLPVDSNYQPLPLYTYPAIEYLNSLNFKDKKIFEFGSGNSTLYWLKVANLVCSVEHNKDWINKISTTLQNNHNHKYILASTFESYVNSIVNFDNGYFDVIIIDGSFSRYSCAKNAIYKIKSDGLIILDNSDWYPNTAKFLKEQLNFIQIDFYGFRPSKPDAAVTSLFLSRDFNFKPRTSKQPNYAIGGKKKHSTSDF